MESLTTGAPDSITRIHSETPVSELVVSSVAQAKGVDPIELEPLYNVVDPDALDQIFASSSGESSMKLSFEMAGCEIVVDGNRKVVVTPPEQESSSFKITSLED